jgi:hypothetical protein
MKSSEDMLISKTKEHRTYIAISKYNNDKPKHSLVIEKKAEYGYTTLGYLISTNKLEEFLYIYYTADIITNKTETYVHTVYDWHKHTQVIKNKQELIEFLKAKVITKKGWEKYEAYLLSKVSD